MYFKFIFLSLKRSIKTYFIYMITLVICVALFYSFIHFQVNIMNLL